MEKDAAEAAVLAELALLSFFHSAIKCGRPNEKTPEAFRLSGVCPLAREYEVPCQVVDATFRSALLRAFASRM
jgi:hypothetical protein